MTRCELLQKIHELDFVLQEIVLFLDTHPCDEKALAYFKEHSCNRNKLMEEYAKSYGPLTCDTAVDSCLNTWKWTEEPFPWEKKGVCR